LHKRYFDKAKSKEEDDGFASLLAQQDAKKGTGRSPSADASNDLSLSKSRSRSRGVVKRNPYEASKPLGISHIESDDPNFFDLTAKSNTQLGLSQLDQTKL
jgi:hypothetical protein